MKNGTRVKASKALYYASFILCILLLHAGNMNAQSPRIKHVIDKLQKDKSSSLGRDYWFTMAQNYEINQPGKYYALYVTSPNNTTVHIQVTGGTTAQFPIIAGQVVTYLVPLSWEVTTSGVVENKAVRVWSNDADLTAYLLSRNPFTSDGMLIIPTIGWGTEYVVAAYGSLFEGTGTTFDYPSEFCIVANQNNTICIITPSIDIRVSGGQPHKANIPFTEVLQKGQCVQYKAILAERCDDFDVTGSVITSNNPIGVVGASMCPNIPCEFIQCDHICDMIPPTRTWAKTYYTVPFAQRIAGDSYCVIGSKPGQTIKRNHQVYCVLTNKNESYFRSDIEDASIWESDAPFLLAQYINSWSYESGNGGSQANLGDPAMVVVNAVEQYIPHIIFQTPNIQGSDGFSNFCNIMVNNTAILTTLYDGKPISSAKGGTRIQIPFTNYTAFRIAHIEPGKHEVQSDSGIGVYIYGYGSHESYAWSGGLGIQTFNDPDTIPPVAIPSGDCFAAYVSMTDSHSVPPASKISEMKIDSFYNMLYTPDPNYQIGVATLETFYSMNVIDPSKEAFLKIETHDYSGNRTIVTSTYAPQRATLTPSIQNFGSGNVGVETCKNFTITNTGETIITWQYIKLLIGTKGFSIKNLDNSPLAPGATRDIMVCFTPPTPSLASDTLELFDGCKPLRAIVVGTGGQPDFVVGDDDFGCQLVGSVARESKSTIVNTSKSAVTIDSIYVDDKVHFGFDATTPATNILPIKIGQNGQRPIEFTFMPDKLGNFTTLAHFHSIEIGWKTAILIGCGISPGASISKDTLQVSQCGAVVPFTFTIKSTGSAPTTITNVIVTGDPGFQSPITQFEDQSGNTVNLPITLGTDQKFIAYTTFTPAPKASGRFTAKVFAVSSANDTTNFATAMVDAIWREIRIGTDAVTMPVVAFGSAPVGSSFQFCNDLADPVSITSMTPVPGPYSAAFSITNFKVGGVVKTLPFSLAKGECVDIGVVFNPSVSPDSLQTADFSLSTDACFPYFKATATAGVKIGPPTILGADITPTILSCSTRDTFVAVTNSDVTRTITNITLTGDAANFTQKPPASMTLAAGSVTNIPITFSPTASAGPIPTNYSVNVTVTLSDASNRITVLTGVVTGSANGMSAEVSSNFAVQDQTAEPNQGTILKLPMDIKFTRNGLNVPVTDFGITKIRLVYNYKADILELATANVMTSVKPIAGWTVDPASSVDNVKGILTVILTGNAPLDDATTSFGSIWFYPTLTKSSSKSTTVNLSSSDLLTSSGAAVGNCLSVTQKGTQFALIYSCGDSTLAYFLRTGNAPSMINPINPNPVSSANGGIVNFQYVTRHEGIVSILIYDELGREAGRVVSGQYHPAGTYEVHYDASHLSSGTYVYRFQLDRHHAISGRMVVGN